MTPTVAVVGRPVPELGVHTERCVGEVDVRVGLVRVERRRKHLVVQRQGRLQHARCPGRPLEVTDVRLHRAERDRPGRQVELGECFADAVDLDEPVGETVGYQTRDERHIGPATRIEVVTEGILTRRLQNQPDLPGIACVIFDEIHFLDDVERGTVWEESLIFAPPNIRFVCLSATISNLDQLGAWLREIRPHDLSVIRSDKRPVQLKDHLFSAHEGLFVPERLGRVLYHCEPVPRCKRSYFRHVRHLSI